MGSGPALTKYRKPQCPTLQFALHSRCLRPFFLSLTDSEHSSVVLAGPCLVCYMDIAMGKILLSGLCLLLLCPVLLLAWLFPSEHTFWLQNGRSTCLPCVSSALKDTWHVVLSEHLYEPPCLMDAQTLGKAQLLWFPSCQLYQFARVITYSDSAHILAARQLTELIVFPLF